jgi:hypothetical protein
MRQAIRSAMLKSTARSYPDRDYDEPCSLFQIHYADPCRLVKQAPQEFSGYIQAKNERSWRFYNHAQRCPLNRRPILVRPGAYSTAPAGASSDPATALSTRTWPSAPRRIIADFGMRSPSMSKSWETVRQSAHDKAQMMRRTTQGPAKRCQHSFTAQFASRRSAKRPRPDSGRSISKRYEVRANFVSKKAPPAMSGRIWPANPRKLS